MQLEIKHNIQNDPEFVGYLGPDRGEKSDSGQEKIQCCANSKIECKFPKFYGD